MKNKKLRDLAIEASKKAYSPYSKVRVGCALKTKSGEIFTGCNIENASFGATICAERVAILKAISNGNKLIEKIYIYTDKGWPPCGLCLQVINEFKNDKLIIVIGDKKGSEQSFSLNDLLPFEFSKNNLNKNI